MDLPLHLRAAGAAERLRVVVRVAEGTPFARARDVLGRAAGAPPTASWWVGARRLGPEDRLGFPPLLDGAELVWAVPGRVPVPGERTAARRATIEARVVAGPEAGRIFPVPPGAWVLGRGGTADLALVDAGLSRRHACLTIFAEGARIADLGSADGTTVGAAPAGPRGVELPLGTPVAMAGTVLVLAQRSSAPPSAHPPTRAPANPDPGTTQAAGPVPRGDGTLGVNRAPRVPPEAGALVLQLPAAPNPAERPRFSALVLLLPLAVAVLAATLLRSPAYLAFGLLGPAMSLAQYAAERRRYQERSQADADRHAAGLEQLQERLEWLLERERRERRRTCPDLATLAAACAARSGELWARRPGDDDWLELSLGRGTVPGRLALRAGDGELVHPRLEGVPLTVALPRSGVLGVAPLPAARSLEPLGPQAPNQAPNQVPDQASAVGVARALVAQAVAWHGPRDLHVWLLVDTPEALVEWDWICATPHGRDPDSGWLARCAAPGESMARVVAELAAILDDRAAARVDSSAHPEPSHLLIWVGATQLREQPNVARLLRDGPAHGLYSICLADAPERLPVECLAVATVSGAGSGGRGAQLRLTSAPTNASGRPDALPADVARRIAADLAPLRDVTPRAGAAVPDLVRLDDIRGADAFDANRLAADWRRCPTTTTFALGRDAAGPAEFDLRADGPHALVGGTTGAGKSELLRALVVGLALGNRPDRLGFVLVDYKGGSAFDACARLPHTIGLVTDLDADDTRRALAGLEAELRSREARLREAGAEDFGQYAAAVDAGATGPDGSPLQHLARLVIVVDEFRALIEELPDFVAGLVRLAALGRSLGLHLILATQRPAGIVSADMRANLGLRIALRVRDAVDSLDIVETAEAAAISPRVPGRAVVRSGDGQHRLVQTTYLGDAAGADASERPIEVLRADGPDLLAPQAMLPVLAVETSLGPDHDTAPAAAARRSRGDNDLRRVADALGAAAALVGACPPPPPWLPPLPTEVALAELSGPALREGTVRRDGARPCERPVAPALLVDDPVRQRRWVHSWEPADSHLAVIGGARSGRTTALRTLTVAALDAGCPTRHPTYIVDASGGLAALAGYPHVGAYLRLDHEGALRRLVAALHDRSRTAAGAGAALGADLTAPDAALLVVDGWEQFRAVLDRVDHGAGTDDLVQAVRGGCTLLVSGGRELLSGPLASIVADRLVLDLPDPTDAYLAGVAVRAGHVPPGRARLSRSGLDAQVARVADARLADRIPGDRAAGPAGDHRGAGHRPGPPHAAQHQEAEHRAVTARAAAAADRHVGCPGPVCRVYDLPPLVPSEALPAPTTDLGTPLGLAGDGSTAVLLLDGRGVLIAGPRGSGRTAALAQVTAALEAAGRPWLRFSGRRPGGSPGSPADLARALRDLPGAVCLVDDVDALLGGPYEDLLTAHAESPGAGSVVVAGTLGALIGSYRGLIGVLRRSSYGLLLSPGPRGPELFGHPLPDGEPALPGRGYLVDDGRISTVQVAWSAGADPDLNGLARQPPQPP